MASRTRPTVLSEVDWQTPWLAPWRELGVPLAGAVASGTPVHEALNAAQGAPVRFVPQAELPAGVAYEQFIFDTGSVPTRNNLHDFFNGLVWQRFGQAKQRLNQLQAGAMATRGVGPVRGPLRDACTLLDESGALLEAPPALWQALLARDWQALFVLHRALWRSARVTLFGHAAMEQLVKPRKEITAHVLITYDAINLEVNQGARLAQQLQAPWLATKPFAPLPLLGIPGWWAGNETPGFYDDATVFRPPRHP
ncbi:DUF3025 domain-containing protein [Simplicispira hankyongi]|uniref:DUF3025 domain-containing protein n=1 Tax=Simplicispira hankyongi TaxID=2315688 RepID=A0A398CED6_9BURK|nr:DUF3025 domain-containing protein [Simplicispira hankyongi]RID98550.1 DUF3025 domain-containing protein [Simplicispira hankyongi]